MLQRMTGAISGGRLELENQFDGGADLKRCAGMEQQSRPADVLRVSFKPLGAVFQAILNRSLNAQPAFARMPDRTVAAAPRRAFPGGGGGDIFVIEPRGDLERDAEAWAQAIGRVLRDPQTALGYAKRLRDDLSRPLSWERAVSLLLEALRAHD